MCDIEYLDEELLEEDIGIEESMAGDFLEDGEGYSESAMMEEDQGELSFVLPEKSEQLEGGVGVAVQEEQWKTVGGGRMPLVPLVCVFAAFAVAAAVVAVGRIVLRRHR